MLNYAVLHQLLFSEMVLPLSGLEILLILVAFSDNYVIKIKRSQMKPEGKAKDNKEKRDGICHKLEL